MTFVRKRMYREGNRTAQRYQLVATYREGGKVRQRVASLSHHPTVEEALHAFRESVACWEAALAKNEVAQGWRAHRRRNQRREELNVLLGKARDKLARLEAVVSTMSRRIDTLDTTGR
jgi:hypothetical protein